MIELGLTKLALIGVVALIVIGPEKLPKVARMAGSLLGRAQRYLNQVKAEISRDMELDELHKMRQEVEQAATELQSKVTSELHQVQQSVNSIWPNPDSKPLADIQSHPHDAGMAHMTHKAREFRRKKRVRTSALPTWYKHQQRSKSHILSAAARVAKYRPAASRTSIRSFY